MSMQRPVLFSAAAASFALAFACGPSSRSARPEKPRTEAAAAPHDDTLREGVATADTWIVVRGFKTRIRVPRGWKWAQRGPVVVGFAPDDGAAYVLAGTSSDVEAKQTLTKAATKLNLQLGTDKAPAVDTVVNGIAFSRKDFEARVAGKPARAVALATDEPPSKSGYVLFLGYVLDGNAAHDAALRESINSLSPE